MSLQSVKAELSRIEDTFSRPKAEPTGEVLVEDGTSPPSPPTVDAKLAMIASQMTELADQLQAVSEDARKISQQILEGNK